MSRDRPQGFEDLLAPHESEAELFVDGRAVGTSRVVVAPGTVRFLDPQQVLELLPPLRHATEVLAALSRPLESNVALSCYPRRIRGCGVISPAVAAIILSRDRNRIDLFIAASFRGPPRRFLPDPSPGGPSIAGSLGLHYAASSRGLDWTLYERAITAFGRSHVAIDSIFGDHTAQLDRLYVRHVSNNRTLTAGLFPAAPFSFIYQDRFLGLGLTSSEDTLVDRVSLSSSPLIVDSSLGGRVEIFRDGVLLDTQSLTPGQVLLDTSRLPSGAYPLTLRIKDASGERTETRFFVADASLPPYDHFQYFVEAGTNVAPRFADDAFLPHPQSVAIRAGFAHRLSPSIGLTGRIEASQKRHLAEGGVIFIDRDWRLNASIGLTTERDYALALGGSGRLGDVHWSLDARRIKSASRISDDRERGLGVSYDQLSVFAGWQHRNLSLNSGLIWRKDAGSKPAWTLLPIASWLIGGSGARRWQVDASGSIGRSNWSARLGIRMSISKAGSALSFYGGGEARSNASGPGIEPIIRTEWAKSADRGVDSVRFTGAVSREFSLSYARLGASVATSRFQTSAEAQIEQRLADSALFGQFETLFGLSDGRLAFGSGSFTGAGVIAEIPGAPPDERFAVRTDLSSSRPFTGSGPIFVPLQPFHQSSLGINALGRLALLDHGSDRYVFYPGTVREVSRRAGASIILFMKLVDESGSPLPDAVIELPSGAYETDENGNVQVEVIGSSLDVRTRDGRSCKVELGVLQEAGPFFDAGIRICRASQ